MKDFACPRRVSADFLFLNLSIILFRRNSEKTNFILRKETAMSYNASAISEKESKIRKEVSAIEKEATTIC